MALFHLKKERPTCVIQSDESVPESVSLSNRKKFRCSECHHSFDASFLLDIHVTRAHKQPHTLKCHRCPFQAESKVLLVDHKTEKHGMKFHSCKICSYTTNRKQHLEVHIASHKEKNFPCLKCEFRTNHPDYLKRHVRSTHDDSNTTRYACGFCSFSTASSRYLKTHVRKQHTEEGKQKYECSVCNASFRSFQSIRNHYRERHGNIKYKLSFLNNEHTIFSDE